MAGWRPAKRRDFIRRLRALGFDGPYSGTRHQFMIFGQHRQTIPTNAEYSVPQIRLLLRQVESILARPVSLEEWNSL
jgi:hypothetical protein